MQVPPEQQAIVEPYNNWVRQRVKEVRLASGLSQKLIGSKMQVGHTRIHDLETGGNQKNIQFGTIVRFCYASGTSVKDFFSTCPEF